MKIKINFNLFLIGKFIPKNLLKNGEITVMIGIEGILNDGGVNGEGIF